MRNFLLMVLAIIAGFYLSACGKKQQDVEQMQEPLSKEVLSVLGTETKVPPAQPAEPQVAVSPAVPAVEAKLEPAPPAGPYKPTSEEIQTALKNAGYYTGTIDGKLGPMSKKAIGEFQKANGLEADGKVGPKTWEVLSKYLNPVPEPVPPEPVKKKKR